MQQLELLCAAAGRDVTWYAAPQRSPRASFLSAALLLPRQYQLSVSVRVSCVLRRARAWCVWWRQTSAVGGEQL